MGEERVKHIIDAVDGWFARMVNNKSIGDDEDDQGVGRFDAINK
jgi:phosphatidylserine synthase